MTTPASRAATLVRIEVRAKKDLVAETVAVVRLTMTTCNPGPKTDPWIASVPAREEAHADSAPPLRLLRQVESALHHRRPPAREGSVVNLVPATCKRLMLSRMLCTALIAANTWESTKTASVQCGSTLQLIAAELTFTTTRRHIPSQKRARVHLLALPLPAALLKRSR